MKDNELTPEVRRLVALMADLNLSFDEVAKRLGIAGNTVRRWMSGAFEPNPVYRKMIADGIVKLRQEYGIESRFDHLNSATEEEQAIFLELNEILSRLLPGYTKGGAGDAELFQQSWKGFWVIYRRLRLRHIWGPPKKGIFGRPGKIAKPPKGRFETKTFEIKDLKVS